MRAHNSPVLFEELYDKLTDFEIYLKREDKLLGPSIMAQVNQKSTRMGYQYNKTINKGSTKMLSEPLSSNQTPPPHHQHFNHDNQGGYFNHQQSWHPRHTNQRRVVYQLCDKLGHSAKVYRSRPRLPTQSY